MVMGTFIDECNAVQGVLCCIGVMAWAGERYVEFEGILQKIRDGCLLLLQPVLLPTAGDGCSCTVQRQRHFILSQMLLERIRYWFFFLLGNVVCITLIIILTTTINATRFWWPIGLLVSIVYSIILWTFVRRRTQSLIEDNITKNNEYVSVETIDNFDDEYDDGIIVDAADRQEAINFIDNDGGGGFLQIVQQQQRHSNSNQRRRNHHPETEEGEDRQYENENEDEGIELGFLGDRRRGRTRPRSDGSRSSGRRNNNMIWRPPQVDAATAAAAAATKTTSTAVPCSLSLLYLIAILSLGIPMTIVLYHSSPSSLCHGGDGGSDDYYYYEWKLPSTATKGNGKDDDEEEGSPLPKFIQDWYEHTTGTDSDSSMYNYASNQYYFCQLSYDDYVVGKGGSSRRKVTDTYFVGAQSPTTTRIPSSSLQQQKPPPSQQQQDEDDDDKFLPQHLFVVTEEVDDDQVGSIVVVKQLEDYKYPRYITKVNDNTVCFIAKVNPRRNSSSQSSNRTHYYYNVGDGTTLVCGNIHTGFSIQESKPPPPSQDNERLVLGDYTNDMYYLVGYNDLLWYQTQYPPPRSTTSQNEIIYPEEAIIKGKKIEYRGMAIVSVNTTTMESTIHSELHPLLLGDSNDNEEIPYYCSASKSHASRSKNHDSSKIIASIMFIAMPIFVTSIRIWRSYTIPSTSTTLYIGIGLICLFLHFGGSGGGGGWQSFFKKFYVWFIVGSVVWIVFLTFRLVIVSPSSSMLSIQRRHVIMLPLETRNPNTFHEERNLYSSSSSRRRSPLIWGIYSVALLTVLSSICHSIIQISIRMMKYPPNELYEIVSLLSLSSTTDGNHFFQVFMLLNVPIITCGLAIESIFLYNLSIFGIIFDAVSRTFLTIYNSNNDTLYAVLIVVVQSILLCLCARFMHKRYSNIMHVKLMYLVLDCAVMSRPDNLYEGTRSHEIDEEDDGADDNNEGRITLSNLADEGTMSHEIDEEDDGADDNNEGRIALSDLAPPVDYNVLVLENNGVKVGRRKGMGRVAIATRDFDIQKTDTFTLDDRHHRNDSDDWWLFPILKERPAIVCKSYDYLEYAKNVLDLPPSVQVGVLDMFYQPLDSTVGRELEEPAQFLQYLGVLEDVHVLHQLLSLYLTNAHKYREENTSAMMILGSKMTHSCIPNIGYSCWYDNKSGGNDTLKGTKEVDESSIDEGFVSYIILRPIRKGDILTCSYLSDLFETPTCIRRWHLKETKSFWCQCPRCTGPDYCRVMPCPNCSKYNPCYSKNDEASKSLTNDSYWMCTNCDNNGETNDGEPSYCSSLDDYLLSLELGMESTISVLERHIESWMTNSLEVTPSAMLEAIEECQSVLSPTHYLTATALRLLMDLCTSRAYVQIKRRLVRDENDDYESDSIVRYNFWNSIRAGFQLILVSECVAASCLGCGPVIMGEFNITAGLRQDESIEPTTSIIANKSHFAAHPPLYDRATPMKHVCDNMLQLPISWWQPYAVEIVQRYIPILRAKYGSKVVKEFQQRIIHPFRDGKVTCFVCGTTDTPTPWIPYEKAATTTIP